MPAFNPYRILDDSNLVEMLARYSISNKRLYLVTHFNHPRELTEAAIEGLTRIIDAGVICVNQTPILAGINDSPSTLGTLFAKLSYLGVPPYYVFQNRPTRGNKVFRVPIVRGWYLFQLALGGVSGLARRARFTMSHHTGKLEIVGVNRDYIYMRYHLLPGLSGFAMEINPSFSIFEQNFSEETSTF